MTRTELEKCMVPDGFSDAIYSGAMCGGDCSPFWIGWCNEITATSCGTNFTTTDQIICSNITMWSELGDCGTSGDLVEGHRCSGGYSGQCIFQTTSDPTLLRSCDDKSDQVHEVNQTCPDTSGYNKEQDGYCKDTCSDFGHESERCKKCPSDVDPHNCTGSCDNPDTPQCTACTNKHYFICPRSGQCIHPDLRCDLFPQCRLGEDEEGCIELEMYKKKNLVPEESTFLCESPHYFMNNSIVINGVSKSNLSVKITAIRCNNITECHGNLDEIECNNDLLNYFFLVLVLILLTATSIGLQTSLEKCVRRFGRVGARVSDGGIELQAGGDGGDMFLNHLIRCKTKADMRLLKQVLEDRHNNNNMEDVNLSMAALQNMTTIDRKEKKR